jgi:AcrR family transcriptional regulator
VRTKSPHQADKILAAASHLFAARRFHEARMEDIAALAEVGKGTLYRYFKDKEELYLALLDQAAKGLEEKLRNCLEGISGPREQLVAVVDHILDYFDANPHLFDLIQHAETMQKPGQEFPWQKARTRTTELVKDIFRAGVRQGLFAMDDLDMANMLLLGGLRAVMRFGPKPRPANLAQRVVAGFLDGHWAPGARPASRSTRPGPVPIAEMIDGAASAVHST